MPVIIRRKLASFMIKKRHLSFILAILIIVIMVYRASSVAYHFHALTLGKLVIEDVKIQRNPTTLQQESKSDPLFVEVTMNISKCTCPVFLEIMDINGMLFMDEKNTDALHVTINNIKFDKQKPVECKAVLGFDTSNFKKPLLDLFRTDFVIEFSFLIRARFCMIPLCFSKVLRRRKSELVMKIENSVGSSIFETRIHTIDNIPCIQFGVRRKLFQTINAGPHFTFDVGCVKLTLGGIFDFTVIITSFSINSYIKNSNITELNVPRTQSKRDRLNNLTSIMPGVLNDGEDENSTVFYFVSIPLYSFGGVIDGPKILRGFLEDKIRALRVERISVLLEDDKEDALDGFIDDEKNQSIFVVTSEEPIGPIILARRTETPLSGARHKKEKGWKLSDLNLFDIKGSEDGIIKQVEIHDFIIEDSKFECKIGVNKDHPAYKVFKNIQDILEVLGAPETEISIVFHVILNGNMHASITGSFICKEGGNGNVQNTRIEAMKIEVKSFKPLFLRKEDAKNVQFELAEFHFGRHTIIFNNALHFNVDYPRSINIAANNSETYALHKFKREEQKSIIIEHNISNYNGTNILKVNSSIDMTSYGFRDHSNVIPVGDSFIRVEIPQIILSITNPFIKMRLSPKPGKIDFSLKTMAGRGIARIESVVVLQKVWDMKVRFDEAFLRDDITLKLESGNFSFTFNINEFTRISDSRAPQQPIAVGEEVQEPETLPKKQKFAVVLPLEFTLASANVNSGKILIRHTCEPGESCPIVSYMQCKDTEMYKNHGLYASFAKCGHSQVDFGTPQLDSPFYIKNILKGEEISYILFINDIPFISFHVEKGEAVISVTSKNLFVYIPKIVMADMKFIMHDSISKYKMNPTEWMKGYSLHVLIDFIVEAIVRNPHVESTLLSKPKVGEIETYISGGVMKKNLKNNTQPITTNNGEESVFSFNWWIKIPRNQIRKIDCISIVPFGRIEFRPVDNSDRFYILFDILEDINFYSIELTSYFIPDSFKDEISGYINFNSNFIRKINDTVGFNQNFLENPSSILENISLNYLFELISKFITASKNIPNTNSIYEIDYNSESFKNAFNGKSIYQITTQREIPSFNFSFDINLYSLCIDLCIKNIENINSNILVDISINIENILEKLGKILSIFLSPLPFSALPTRIIINFDFKDLLEYSLISEDKEIIFIKILKLINNEKLIIPLTKDPRKRKEALNQQGIINVDKKRKKNSVIIDYAKNWVLSLFGMSVKEDLLPVFEFSEKKLSNFLDHRKKLSIIPVHKESIKMQICIKYEEFDNIFEKLLFSLKHKLSEPINSFIRGINKLTNRNENTRPFMILNLKQPNLVILNLRFPFTVRFLGPPIYLYFNILGSLRSTVRLHGCFMDSYMAMNGYFISIPIMIIEILKDGKCKNIIEEKEILPVLGHRGGIIYEDKKPEEYNNTLKENRKSEYFNNGTHVGVKDDIKFSIIQCYFTFYARIKFPSNFEKWKQIVLNTLLILLKRCILPDEYCEVGLKGLMAFIHSKACYATPFITFSGFILVDKCIPLDPYFSFICNPSQEELQFIIETFKELERENLIREV